MSPPSITDLYLAWRQAKTALYFERRGVGLVDLAQYEAELPVRLEELHALLADGSWFDHLDVGEVWIVPKRLNGDAADDGVVRVGTTAKASPPVLDVQVRLSPSPAFAIAELLYLRRFGPILDGILSKNSIGYRLDLRDGALDATRRWTFEYWPRRYQEFRSAPLNQARAALRRASTSVMVVSADLASFYDSIDPSFLLSEAFVATLLERGLESPEAFESATRSLLAAFGRFRAKAESRLGVPVRIGVPIGSLTSRVVANLSLSTLDEHIEAQPGVLSYRRYVDDLVVVANAPDSVSVDAALSKLLPLRESSERGFVLDVEALQRAGCEFELQRRKIKVHHLAGEPGEDFVEAVLTDFDRLVSRSQAFLDTAALLDDGATHLIRARDGEGSPLPAAARRDPVPSHPARMLDTPTQPPPEPPPTSAASAPAPRRAGLLGLLPELLDWLPRALLVGLAPGFYLWVTTHPGRAAFLTTGVLAPRLRGQLLAWMGATLAAFAALALLRWQRRRRDEPCLRLPVVVDALARDLTALLALPFIAALTAPKIESERPNLALLHAALASLFVVLGAYRLAGRPFPGRDRLVALAARVEPWLPFALVLAIYAGYSAALSYFALLDHWNIWTQIFDLGIYDNILWHTIHGDFLGSSIIPYGHHTAAHFDPILGLLAPIYAIWPRAETLLVVQSLWLGAGVFPLYLLGRDRLRSRWLGLLLAAVYALHPALHGVNMFDFHSLALAIPLMMWAAYEVARGPGWRLGVALALLLAAREDMSLLACFIGLYAIAERHVRSGLAVIAGALAYLAVVKLAIMPDPGLMMTGDKVYGYASFYAEMIPRAEEGAAGLVKNALSNPVFALQVFAKEEKLRFFVQLLLPLLFLPLLAGRARWLWLYGLIFIGLGSRPAMYQLNYQYSSVLFPMLLVAAGLGLARVEASPALAALGLAPARVRAALAAGLLTATALTSWKFGVLVENSAFMAGWQPLIRNPDDALKLRYQRLQEMIAQIPRDAAVSASSEIGSQLSNRDKLYRWPDVRDAEYLLLGAWRFEAKEREHLEAMKRTTFELLDEHDGIELLRRRAPASPAARPAARPRPAGP